MYWIEQKKKELMLSEVATGEKGALNERIPLQKDE